ncbi:tRNA (adenosine(37)-N6)-threonylcarbamoyltransferase complex transferase subunit TsaD, partial [Mycoplasmopsis synoviae]
NIAILQNFLQEFIDFNKIDHIAYTSEPGLIVYLQVGFLFASALSIALNKPLIKFNHLDGHFFSGAIDNKEIKYPSLGLIVSGGHRQIIYAKNK